MPQNFSRSSTILVPVVQYRTLRDASPHGSPRRAKVPLKAGRLIGFRAPRGVETAGFFPKKRRSLVLETRQRGSCAARRHSHPPNAVCCSARSVRRKHTRWPDGRHSLDFESEAEVGGGFPCSGGLWGEHCFSSPL